MNIFLLMLLVGLSCTESKLLVEVQKYGVGFHGKYGNLSPTGASWKTAKSDNLTYDGVPASYEMASTDLTAMNRYKSIILRAATSSYMDPAVIAGIISRESRAGKALVNGWGDHGNAWGLMQIDKRYHKLKGDWNSLTHVLQGTQILINFIVQVQAKFPTWRLDQQLQGGIAAYNYGIRNVRSWDKLDKGTTHNDYSNDVVARAQFFRQNGYN